MNTERLAVLAAFIRNQASLTDTKPPAPGPGCVQLNNAEAIEVADALDDIVGGALLAALKLPTVDFDTLKNRAIREAHALHGGDTYKIARACGVSHKTVYNYLHALRLM